MASSIMIKISFLLNIVLLTLNKSEQILCSENNTLLETMGDAILTDVNYGQYCNISSSKGLQQISTVLDVVRTLNQYDYVPDMKLGVRVLDTCHDKIIVFKQILRLILEQNCANYEMGVLVPSEYSSMVNFFHDYSDDLPIVAYGEPNFTMPTIDILAHYLSTEYEVIDLVHANLSSILKRFLEVTRDVGVCVKRHDRYGNIAEEVVVAIGERDDIQRWLGESEDSKDISGKTWLLLPLDNSDIDDLLPPGSYVVKPKTSDFDLNKFSNVNEFLEKTGDSMNNSPYLLGIGKAIVELAEVFQEVQKRGCPTDDDNDGSYEENCVTTPFRSQSQREIRDSDVYEALRMQPSSHSVRYAIAMKTRQHELVDVALYEIEVSELRILPAKLTSGMPGLCLESLIENCENCANFQKRSEERKVITKDVISRNILKNSVYVPIFLIAVVCGTLVCCIIVILIVRRFGTEETFDGNPTFTIVLVLANIFTLLTVLPFCFADDYFGAQKLNARKILHATLAFGFTFSIMLSRALFLALSANDIFVAHINGYLHSLMAFFMFGVQVAISVTYFVLNTRNSAVIARSPIFIALLGYDIFLLLSLFIASCSIIQIQRNYYEGKCFFSTAIGLLVVWTIWLICFIVMQSKNRDTVVCFGIIGTAYSIIFGILIPKIYYMITPLFRKKDIVQRFNHVNLPTDSIAKQSCSSYEYIHPVRENQILRMSTYSDYYGNLNPNSKRLDRCEGPHHREMSGYGNHGFQTEMKETDAVHVAPRICIESLRNLEVASNNVIYAQPRIYKSRRIALGEKSNAEAICDRDNSSPTLRIYNEIYPMRYASPTNMIREQKIDEEDENEDEENEEQKYPREDEDFSFTRL
ncbi:protein bride of sevenless isoform X2 [Nylanderia fulva]|uniref:protein bride of sevenless isoform X2 n=1 Tax=Nylanderia fulva TaxID=613905 RepID=UPI0010FBB1CE|nr:protein bride of sevenless isoform X2 [Nylanderia fulva]